jgi:hypothetical protein
MIVVEDRDPHPLAQPALDLEALRRLDVLEIDRAEGRLERGDDVAEAGRVAFLDLDVEGVDPGELLEQNRLALHHRLGRERADRAQAEDGGAVGDHRDEVAARGQRRGLGGVSGDRQRSGSDTGRVGEREIALRRERLGRHHPQLPRCRVAVVVERVITQLVGHRRPAHRLKRALSAGAGRAPVPTL